MTSLHATPHRDLVPSTDDLALLEQQFDLVTNLSTDVNLLRGTEVRLSPDIRLPEIDLGSLTLADSNYVLVDFPSGAWPYYAEDVLFRVQTLGFRPILAHPERYGWTDENRDLADSLVQRGVLLQVTLASLAGTFGKRVRSIASDLIQSGHVHLVATDAHGMDRRFAGAAVGMKWIDRQYGDTALHVLLDEHPRALLESDDIQPYKPASRRSFPGVNLSWLHRRS